jgi:hypothetical protein
MEFCATVTVKNTGQVTGSEVVQIYVTPSSTTKLTHPVRSLRGYAKAKDLKLHRRGREDGQVRPELLVHCGEQVEDREGHLWCYSRFISRDDRAERWMTVSKEILGWIVGASWRWQSMNVSKI